MSDQIPQILPTALVDRVGHYVEKELGDAAKYDNRELFDESGVSDLLRLAADLYRAGYADGIRAQEAADWVQRRITRARDDLVAGRG